MIDTHAMWKDWGTFKLLEEFGLWANQPAELTIGYPKKTAFATMQGGSIRMPEIDDDTAVFIQDCLNRLAARHPLQSDLVVQFYVRNRTFEKAAQVVGMSKSKAFQQLKCAEAWIDSKLDDYFRLEKAQRQLLTINISKKAG